MNRAMLGIVMRTLLHRCVFVTLLAVLGAGILAGQTDVEALRIKAEQGDAVAQTNLGVAYADGEGVPQNYTEALKWYRLAAEQSYARAQNSLGAMYANGQGVPQDYAEALKWFPQGRRAG